MFDVEAVLSSFAVLTAGFMTLMFAFAIPYYFYRKIKRKFKKQRSYYD